MKNMKRLLISFLAICLLTACIPMVGRAAVSDNAGIADHVKIHFSVNDSSFDDASATDLNAKTIWQEFLISGKYLNYTKDWPEYIGVPEEYVMIDIDGDGWEELIIISKPDSIGFRCYVAFACDKSTSAIENLLVEDIYGSEPAESNFGTWGQCSKSLMYSPKYHALVYSPTNDGMQYHRSGFWALRGGRLSPLFIVTFDATSIGESPVYMITENEQTRTITETQWKEYLDTTGISFLKISDLTENIIEDLPENPEEEPIQFWDVPANEYYYNAVEWAVENGITAGTGNGTFSPNAVCTRAQIVTFLYRNFGKNPSYDEFGNFSDVKSNEYYFDAVQWAVNNHVTAGTGNGKFSPNAPCTRAQAVTFLWRACGSPSPNSYFNPFLDVPSTEYYYKAVLWAVENRITAGTNDVKFSPNTSCTRAQIVTFLYRNSNQTPAEDDPTEETDPSSKSMYQTVLRNLISEQNSNDSDYSSQDIAKGFYYDLNNDGIEELIVQHWLEEKNSDGYITPFLAVSAYTISNGKCVALLENELVYRFVGGPRCSIGAVEDNGSRFLCLQSETGETGGGPIHRYGWLKLYSLSANMLSVSSEAEYSYYTKTTGGIDTQKSDAVLNGDIVPYSQYQAMEKEINAKTVINMDDGISLNALLSLSQ